MSDTERNAGLAVEVERLREENAKLRGELVHCDLAIAHLRAEVARLEAERERLIGFGSGFITRILQTEDEAFFDDARRTFLRLAGVEVSDA